MKSCFVTSSCGAWHCYYEVVTFLNSAVSKLHKGRTLCKVFCKMDYISLCFCHGNIINASVISKHPGCVFAPSCQVWCWFVSKATLTATSTWWPTPTWRATWREGRQSMRSVTPLRGSSRGGNTPGVASIAPPPPLNTRTSGLTGGRRTTLTPLISKTVLKEEISKINQW